MRVLILDNEIRGRIREIIEYARAHPVPLKVLRRMAEGSVSSIGNNPAHACTISLGYRAVFSIEEHPGGWMRHLSVSIPGGKLPHPAALEEIAQSFGFSGDIGECERWVEKVGTIRAVNLVQPLA